MSDDNTLGDGPIEPRYSKQMRALGNVIDDFFNGPKPRKDRKTGFILMVFPFAETEIEAGAQGRANYISNADRRDVVVMLKEQLARFEGQPEMKGRA